MNYRNAHNVHFNLWSCISSLPFWKLSILNCISVLWSQSQHLFAHSLILSFLSTKYCAGLNRAASRNTVTSSPVDNLKLQKPHWREGRRLGIPAWALGHKGRTSSLTKNRTRSKKLWKMPLYYLYAKSQIFQLFSTVLSIGHKQMTSVTCVAGQRQSPYGFCTLSSTRLPGPCLSQSLYQPFQTFIAHRHCVLSPALILHAAVIHSLPDPVSKWCRCCALENSPVYFKAPCQWQECGWRD